MKNFIFCAVLELELRGLSTHSRIDGSCRNKRRVESENPQGKF